MGEFGAGCRIRTHDGIFRSRHVNSVLPSTTRQNQRISQGGGWISTSVLAFAELCLSTRTTPPLETRVRFELTLRLASFGFADRSFRPLRHRVMLDHERAQAFSHARFIASKSEQYVNELSNLSKRRRPRTFRGSGPSVMASWCLSLTSAHTNPNLLHAYCM